MGKHEKKFVLYIGSIKLCSSSCCMYIIITMDKKIEISLVCVNQHKDKTKQKKEGFHRVELYYKLISLYVVNNTVC